jgi:CPA2 family monovalent cation:H+ antiporter-2
MILAVGADATVLLELGAVLLALGVLGRLAARIGLPAIPLYLLAGLVVGDGGLYSLEASLDFIETGADIGVVLLLFMLGLEYTTDELTIGLHSHRNAGMVDAVANFTPGFAIGLLLGWEPLAAALLGGVTYVSSSGIVARLLDEFERLGNRETPVVLSLLVMEDLAMAVYLPIVAGLLVGDGPVATLLSIATALAVVAVVLYASGRFGGHVSRLVNSESAELVLLTVLGLTLLVAGLAEEAEISSAVGAFLVGVSLSGRVAEQSRQVLAPVRDLFAGIFFVFFGLQVDPSDLGPAVGAAVALAVITGATKYYTGWWAARRAGIGPRGRIRAGTVLLPRGEFSIVIAELGVAAGLTADVGPVTACYVLILAVAGSIIARYADEIASAVQRRRVPRPRPA